MYFMCQLYYDSRDSYWLPKAISLKWGTAQPIERGHACALRMPHTCTYRCKGNTNSNAKQTSCIISRPTKFSSIIVQIYCTCTRTYSVDQWWWHEQTWFSCSFFLYSGVCLSSSRRALYLGQLTSYALNSWYIHVNTPNTRLIHLYTCTQL